MLLGLLVGNKMEIMLIKIIIAAGLFGSLFFTKDKWRWIIALILTAYLVMIGAEVI